MFTSRYAWLQQSKHKHTIKFCLFCLLCLAAGALVWFSFTLVHTSSTSSDGLSLDITTGFDSMDQKSTYRSDYWTPIHVTLNNAGPSFKGTLAIRTYSDPSFTTYSDMTSPWSFETPVILPHGSLKVVTINAPHFLSPYSARGFMATLRDEQNTTVASKLSQVDNEVKPGDLLVGLLTNSDTSNYDPLKNETAAGGNQNLLDIVSLPDASHMPDMDSVLENFDIIILENFPTSTLSTTQINALQSWVNRGGILIEVGGVYWQRTLVSLPEDLLPVHVNGLDILPPGTPILPVGGTPQAQPNAIAPPPTPTPPLEKSLIVSTATMRNQPAFSSVETLVGAQNNDLIVKAHQGSGTVCYLGFDPALTPFTGSAGWPGTTTQVWPTLIRQLLGDKLLVPDTAMGYDSGPGQILTRGGILDLLIPALPRGPWNIGLFLLVYLLLLGPVSLLITRRLKHARFWRWRVLTCCILLCTALSYTFAASQRGAALSANSISIIQVNQAGTSAHVTTYMGLLTPGQGTFHLHIPGENLTQPISSHFLQKNAAVISQDDPQTTITTDTDGTDLNLQNQRFWSMNPLVSEQDSPLPGSITAHLSLSNDRLVGTITNTLNTSLSDLYVLFPHSFVPIKHINAGATLTINAPISTAPASSGKLLADQLAEYNKLGNDYFPYTHHQQPQNTIQQHMALLSALSGAGYTYDPCSGSCLTHSIINRGVIYTTGGQAPNPNLRNDYDPLLISGAPATLIGWADHSIAGVDSTTINGTQPPGEHSTLIQMPVKMQFVGPLHVPQDFITGSIIDTQLYGAQAILPGMYTLNNSQVTFELPLINDQPLQLNSLTVTVPDLIAHPSGAGSGSAAYKSALQVQLYNWQQSTWDTVTMQSDDTTTITNIPAYAGTTGRVLVQVGSTDQTQTIYFGKPSLSMSGLALQP